MSTYFHAAEFFSTTLLLNHDIFADDSCSGMFVYMNSMGFEKLVASSENFAIVVWVF
jgi:hypothetical protein